MGERLVSELLDVLSVNMLQVTQDNPRERAAAPGFLMDQPVKAATEQFLCRRELNAVTVPSRDIHAFARAPAFARPSSSCSLNMAQGSVLAHHGGVHVLLSYRHPNAHIEEIAICEHTGGNLYYVKQVNASTAAGEGVNTHIMER